MLSSNFAYQTARDKTTKQSYPWMYCSKDKAHQKPPALLTTPVVSYISRRSLKVVGVIELHHSKERIHRVHRIMFSKLPQPINSSYG